MEEKQLIAALKRGEDRAFEEFVERYGDRLYRSLYLIVKEEAMARDLVQETFLKVIKNVKGFKGESSLYTWVYRIAVNQMKDEFRKTGREVLGCEGVEQGRSHVESDVIRNEQNREVAECLREIPIKYRKVMTLFYYEEMKIKDIARILEEKEGTIKSKLHRGKKALKDMLREREVFHEKETV